VASAASNYLEGKVLEQFLRAVAFTWPTTIYAALLTDSNTGSIAFGTATTTGNVTVTAIAFYDAATVGNLLYWCDLTSSQTVANGNVVSVAAAALSISLT
jgi:hypothetical protein